MKVTNKVRESRERERERELNLGREKDGKR